METSTETHTGALSSGPGPDGGLLSSRTRGPLQEPLATALGPMQLWHQLEPPDWFCAEHPAVLDV